MQIDGPVAELSESDTSGDEMVPCMVHDIYSIEIVRREADGHSFDVGFPEIGRLEAFHRPSLVPAVSEDAWYGLGDPMDLDRDAAVVEMEMLYAFRVVLILFKGLPARLNRLFIVLLSDIKVDVAALTAHGVGIIDGQSVAFEKHRLHACRTKDFQTAC